MFAYSRFRCTLWLVVFVFCVISCGSTNVSRLSPVEEAKLVIQSHERFARAGDLDKIMSNAAEDIVVLAANTPLIQGKQAFREFYASLLKAGSFDFGHEYAGGEVVADTVVLHGVARGTFTPVGARPNPFANNFILVLKKQPSGKYQFWRIAFAPSQT